eukprot:TRINITY_DN5531_c0_g3_i8.p1 TRINITY_DN5531_c0_g3~~TRINITY_DN5531_c0_g3_i8.p1  ORF type:complete len:130 (-),score=16.66 TRINITY_DN5531_c0_g3_i8:159-548(-)
MKAEELIYNCISYFNKVLREGNYGVQLRDNDKLYNLYIAKKNGKVKDDFPRKSWVESSDCEEPDDDGAELHEAGHVMSVCVLGGGAVFGRCPCCELSGQRKSQAGIKARQRRCKGMLPVALIRCDSSKF